MTEQVPLERLRCSVEDWNSWRKHHPEIQPYLRGANLEGANLEGADLKGVDLEGAILTGADLKAADLRGANLSEAFLSTSDLSYANLSQAVLSEAFLNRAHLWYTNLGNAYLQEASLKLATLRGAILKGADLRGVNLSEANLHEADLSEADLANANLSRTSLHRTALRGADLMGTLFRETDLSGADVSRARCGWTSWINLDLRTVKGLDTLIHTAPSTIGIDTLYRSQGYIPEEFLRQAGVPEDFLLHLPLLFNSTREYFTCFICFTREDETIAKRLCDDLRANGIACWTWWVPSDSFPTEEQYGERLEQAIFRSDALILILSERGLYTDWMRHIRSIARGREDHEHRQVLFPLRLDQAIVDAPDLKRYGWENLYKTHPIADFTHWQDPDSYQQAFEQLLADLRTSRPHPGNTGIDR
jgi:uncharacterized protein YjbI with pentapeptide repeats